MAFRVEYIWSMSRTENAVGSIRVRRKVNSNFTYHLLLASVLHPSSSTVVHSWPLVLNLRNSGSRKSQEQVDKISCRCLGNYEYLEIAAVAAEASVVGQSVG